MQVSRFLRARHLRHPATFASLLISGAALAQSPADAYPGKPVTVIVAQTPGGPNDQEARVYMGRMQTILGQPFVLDFKPGAGSVIGTQYVARSAPDGYTLLLVAMPLLKANKVRVLAITDDKRSKHLPDVPTVAEQGIPGFSYSNWLGFVSPAATPAGIVNKLADSFARVARVPEVIAALEADGTVMVGSTPAQFRQLIATESVRWKKLVQDAGIKVEN